MRENRVDDTSHDQTFLWVIVGCALDGNSSAMACMQIKRDLHRIGGNLILVVFPFKNRDQQSAALRNWDLWGPMVTLLVVTCSIAVATVNFHRVLSCVHCLPSIPKMSVLQQAFYAIQRGLISRWKT